MKAFLLVVVAFVLSLASPAFAKNCKKGCPCGNSCIACDKMCRIDSAPSPTPFVPASIPSATPSSSAPGDLVHGYVKKDGTRIDAYRRSGANSTQTDNWSTTGNVNPYNGKKGSKKAKK